MAGRRERQKRERETRILRAATRLFATRGYAGTGIQDIAGCAELAVGTIYNYFRSKPEIALAIARRDTSAGVIAGDEVLRDLPSDPAAAVACLVDRFLEPFLRADRALWRELVGAAMVDPALAGGFFAQDLRLIGQLTFLLTRLQARGDLRLEVAPGRGALAIYGVFFSWFMAAISSDAVTDDTLASEVRHGIDLVMNGLLSPKRKEGKS